MTDSIPLFLQKRVRLSQYARGYIGVLYVRGDRLHYEFVPPMGMSRKRKHPVETISLPWKDIEFIKKTRILPKRLWQRLSGSTEGAEYEIQPRGSKSYILKLRHSSKEFEKTLAQISNLQLFLN